MDCTNEKYSCLSSVNVAYFVTVRPQLTDEIKLKSNFKLWKKQLICLVESQDVAGFINGEIVEPQEADEQKLWRRSDRLVQGWILGSIGADVLQYVCELETAREVWSELDYIFNFVFSAERDFKIKPSNLWPSSVNVAKFVMVRPQLIEEERSCNFKRWKEQMLCLLKSQDVVGFIEGKMVKPQQADEQNMWRSTDRLVKGWILGSIGPDVLQYVCELETSREVWLELEYIFNLVFSAERDFEMKYRNLWPSSATVAKFVTVRPQLNKEEGERSSNFNIWKEQMVCLLKSKYVVGFIEGEMVELQRDEQKLWRFINEEIVEPQEADEQKLWRRSDRLVQGWILGSIGADVLQYVCELETAREVWSELDYIFNFVYSVERDFEITCSDSWPPSANVAKFVTVRPQLNEEEEERSRNFKQWKKQMLRLLGSQDLVGFVEGEMVQPEQADEKNLRRSTDKLVKLWILGSIGRDVLVKLWILGSIGRDVLQKVCYLKTAREVWFELKKIFNDHQETDSEAASKVKDYKPLFKAAQSGDWKTANEFFLKEGSEETVAVTNEHGETALHVAVRNKGANSFVVKLVQIMPPEALEIRNKDGKTALHLAAIVGNTKAATAMLEKNSYLLYMLDTQLSMATDYATFFGQRETLKCLISNLWECPFEGLGLLFEIIFCKYMDVALDLVKRFPRLARLRDPVDNTCALSVMATRVSLFASRQSFSWWEKLIYRCLPVKQSESRPTYVAGDIEAPICSSFPIINEARKQCKSMIRKVMEHCKSMIWKVMEHFVPGVVKGIKDKEELHSQAVELVKLLCREIDSLPTADARTMFQDSIMYAVEYGISEIVKVIVEMYPAVKDVNGWTIMHGAVIWRSENFFKLIYKKIDSKYNFCFRKDEEDNGLLHLCARLPRPDRLNIVSGAALQMQRELQWFNEMERFVPPSCRWYKNRDGKTARMLFTEQHQKLKEEGESWMKDTANACSIASALIATVVFAASFTLPGGVSSETGIPIFFAEPAFILFATTNAVSLFTSITSLLLFLSILTSRYTEQDFLHVLPKRLCFGLLTLFISITFMLVAFSAAFYLLFDTKLVWFIIPVTTFGWLPVASFVRLQFPLLVDVMNSTYRPRIIRKN